MPSIHVACRPIKGERARLAPSIRLPRRQNVLRRSVAEDDLPFPNRPHATAPQQRPVSHNASNPAAPTPLAVHLSAGAAADLFSNVATT